MAIWIVDGVPGSGKTLYAVAHLLKHFFKIGDDGFYHANDSDLFLYSNIDKLDLPHECLDRAIKDAGGVKKFFAKDHQENLSLDQPGIIYLIDEAQQYFDRKFYDKEVFGWFEYHRHFGQTVYLVTQSINKIPKDISVLVEYTIRALPRSRSLHANDFRYNLLSGKDTFGTEKVKNYKEVFPVYRSASSNSKQSVKRPFIKIALINLAFALFAILGGLFYFKTSFGATSPGEQKSNNIKKQSGESSFYGSSVTDHSGQSTKIKKSSKESRGEVFVSSPPVPSEWVKISSMISYYKNKKPSIRLMYDGVHSIKNFPYPYRISQGDYYAYVPLKKEDHSYDFSKIH